VVQAVRWLRRPLDVLDECAARFGDLFTLRLHDGTYVVTASPAEIRAIYTGDPAQLLAGGPARFLVPVLGANSLITLDGEPHLRMRRLVIPAFTTARARALAPMMTEVAERAVAGWPRGVPVALAPRLHDIALEIITRTLFGRDDTAALRDQLRHTVDLATRPAVVALGRLGVRDRRLGRALARTDAMLAALIHGRRRVRGDHDDALAVMMDAVDDHGRGLTDRDLRDQLLSLLIAGHETAAASLAWTFDRILREPQVHARLRGVAPDAPYLDAVVREVLRLRPVLPIGTRALASPIRLRGHDIPPGVVVMTAIHLVHRRADVFADPERFCPERFLAGAIDPYAWLPFGIGVRRCVGMGLALVELAAVTAAVLRRVELRLVSPAPEAPVWRGITIVPAGGVRAIVA
jgi:cytochrome P450 family 135